MSGQRTKELKLLDSEIQAELDELAPEEVVPHMIKQIDKYESMLYGARYQKDRLNIEMHIDIYKNKIEEYVKFIQQSIESVCPYTDEHRRRLYHCGFLAAYLARYLERDPWNLREFKETIKTIEKLDKPL